jgi:hypothetical protein
MGTAPDIGSVLSLSNAQGIPEFTLAIRPDGGKALYIHDMKTKKSIGMNLGGDRTASITLSGGLGRSGVILFVQPDGGTSLQFSDNRGKVRIKLGLQPDGSPGLEFFDQEGKSTNRGRMP